VGEEESEEEMALAALALAKVKERFGPEGSSAPAQSGDKNGFVQYGEEALAPDEEEREARREAAISAAKRENLTLLVAENSGGYFGVTLQKGLSRPYRAALTYGGKLVHLGSFATAEEAALCVARTPKGNKKAAAARTPEGKKKAARAQARRPPADEEELEARREAAISAARSEKLTLLVAENSGGYFGVRLTSLKPGRWRSRPYQASVGHHSKLVHLGSFATAEEAALCVARTPEGQKTATRRAKKDGGAKRPRH